MFEYQARELLLKRLNDEQKARLLLIEGRLGRNLVGYEIIAIFGDLGSLQAKPKMVTAKGDWDANDL